jgi:hypothetical protein
MARAELLILDMAFIDALQAFTFAARVVDNCVTNAESTWNQRGGGQHPPIHPRT